MCLWGKKMEKKIVVGGFLAFLFPILLFAAIDQDMDQFREDLAEYLLSIMVFAGAFSLIDKIKGAK